MSKRVAALGMLLAAFAAAPAEAGCMERDPALWRTTPAQRQLYDRLVPYLSCPDDRRDGPLADRIACNYFAGRVLNDLYGVTDFRSGGGWMTANNMLDHVRAHPARWSLLGKANSQSVLDEAARGAAQGQPVIALMRGSPGHVAIILPGAPSPSTGWGLKAPNSAQFSLDNVDGAYVFCRLSYGFSDPSKVEIFWRVQGG